MGPAAAMGFATGAVSCAIMRCCDMGGTMGCARRRCRRVGGDMGYAAPRRCRVGGNVVGATTHCYGMGTTCGGSSV